jgi:hypothetical protein
MKRNTTKRNEIQRNETKNKETKRNEMKMAEIFSSLKLLRSNSRQLSHLARANFRLIFSPSLKDAVPILRINFYRISL